MSLRPNRWGETRFPSDDYRHHHDGPSLRLDDLKRAARRLREMASLANATRSHTLRDWDEGNCSYKQCFSVPFPSKEVAELSIYAGDIAESMAYAMLRLIETNEDLARALESSFNEEKKHVAQRLKEVEEMLSEVTG